MKTTYLLFFIFSSFLLSSCGGTGEKINTKLVPREAPISSGSETATATGGSRP